MKLKKFKTPAGPSYYGSTHFLVDKDQYSVIVLPDGNSVIVLNQYAKPAFMKARTTKAQWYDVAYRIFNESWNPQDDCPWSMTPVETYIFTEGGQDLYFYYWYSRTQSEDFPYHELWCLQNPVGEVVILDKQCLDAEFMAKVGPNWQTWMDMAWAYLGIRLNSEVNQREWPLTAAIQPPILPKFD